ncbi:MAG TPA: hypothetical protein VEY94_06545 [Patescibacteria group bacterium]|nr:hypothetical protein [Patescibacteria group bacterium]
MTYSVKDKDWAWPDKLERWKAHFAASGRVPEQWEAALLAWDGKSDIDSEILAKLADWDWQEYKRDQLEELKGATFFKLHYRAPSADWDHDHCLGCWAKFVAPDYPGEDEVLHEGYVTYIEAAPAPRRLILPVGHTASVAIPQAVDEGMVREWVCEACFEQFKTELDFKLSDNS